jgi:hypothetical protein
MGGITNSKEGPAEVLVGPVCADWRGFVPMGMVQELDMPGW